MARKRRSKLPPRCTGARKDGKPCRFAARRETGLCINHDPSYQQQQRHNIERATEASLEARRHPTIHLHDLDLSSQVGVQAAIETVIRLELEGRLTTTRSRNLLRALSIAARNAHSSSYRLNRDRPQDFDPLRTALLHRLHTLYPTTAPE